MRSDTNIPRKIDALCRVGRETSQAVYRILRRIQLIEDRGTAFVDYLIVLQELQPLSGSDRFRLRPGDCICAALIRVERLDARREIFLEDIGNATSIPVEAKDTGLSSGAGC